MNERGIPQLDDQEQREYELRMKKPRAKEFEATHISQDNKIEYMRKHREKDTGLWYFVLHFIKDYPTELPIFPYADDYVTIFPVDDPNGDGEEWRVDSSDTQYDPRNAYHNFFLQKIE